jgi:hypothetical protein
MPRCSAARRTCGTVPAEGGNLRAGWRYPGTGRAAPHGETARTLRKRGIPARENAPGTSAAKARLRPGRPPLLGSRQTFQSILSDLRLPSSFPLGMWAVYPRGLPISTAIPKVGQLGAHLTAGLPAKLGSAKGFRRGKVGAW